MLAPFRAPMPVELIQREGALAVTVRDDGVLVTPSPIPLRR